MNGDSIALYQMQLKDHNINGKVLAACDLNELRDAMQMAFGDWQLFKAWILGARTREQAASTRYFYAFSLLFYAYFVRQRSLIAPFIFIMVVILRPFY